MRQRFVQSFSTSGTEHEAIYAERLGKPYVAFIYDGQYIDWNTLSPTPPVPPEPVYSAMPLTFEILSSGTITYTHNMVGTTTIYYRQNGGSWTTINNERTGTTTINVVEGDIVEFIGNNGFYASSHNTYDTFSGSTAVFNAYGNLMSMVNGETLTGATSLGNYAFFGLFSQTKIVSAENLVLPAQTLSTYSYGGLFQYCTRLTTGPELTANNVLDTSYGFMFMGCSSLSYIKCTMVPAVEQQIWVQGVGLTGTFVKHPDANWTTGRDGVPEGWTVQDAVL